MVMTRHMMWHDLPFCSKMLQVCRGTSAFLNSRSCTDLVQVLGAGCHSSMLVSEGILWGAYVVLRTPLFMVKLVMGLPSSSTRACRKTSRSVH